ncbi:MAG TPA: CHAD domain-containing protein [Rhizomicrobium sp.]
MAAETELKLIASPRTLAKLPNLPWLREMACGRGKKEKLVSVYFDTPDCELERRHVALRIRRQSGRRIQTIKTETDGAGPLSRGEWEQTVANGRPDLAAATGTPLEPLLNKRTKKTIQPMFETHIERTTIPLRAGASTVELALDRGFVRAGKRRESVHEIELELKQGDTRDLAALAERFVESERIAWGALTKAERGYRLKHGHQRQPFKANEIRLDPSQSVASAFARIGLSCLHHLAGNEAAVRKGDPEGVHQMRIGLRRLRAAISVFKSVVQDEKTGSVKEELKWLTGELAPARDLDVLVEHGLDPLRDEQPAKRDIDILKSDVRDKRKEGLRQAKAALETQRYRELVLRTALWLIAGPWSQNQGLVAKSALQARIDGFAPEVLRMRWKKVAKKSRKADELDASGRHKLRIAVKKLRYSLGFFASLFAGKTEKKARKDFEDLLKTLQDALGKLNDFATHDKFADQTMQLGRCTRKDLRKAYAMGLLFGSEHKRAGACIADVKKTGKKLADAEPFWR